MGMSVSNLKTAVQFFALFVVGLLLVTKPALAQETKAPQETKAAEETKDAKEEEEPLLTIGSKAPNIDVEHWLSDNDGAFEHVTTLESGKVYVIEFWATWCGPCINSMPHLAELQAEYSDSVQFVSVSREDLDKVNKFLERDVRGGEEDQTYADLTNTYCLTTDPDGSVREDYFLAAGRTGIPCAFIVGKTGLIEWIGHPIRMDEALEKIVNDDWDRDAFKVEYKEQRIQEEIALKSRMAMRKVSREIMPKMQELIKAEEYQELTDYLSVKLEDEAYAGVQGVVTRLKVYAMLLGNLDGAGEEFAQYLESSSDNTGDVKSVLSLALRAHMKNGIDPEVLAAGIKSAAAIAAAEPENPSSLATYARFLQIDNKLEKAIEVQEVAVEKAGSRAPAFKKFLNELKEELHGEAEEQPNEADAESGEADAKSSEAE